MERSKNKKLLIAVTLIMAFIVSVFIYSATRNQYGDYLEISNLGEYTSGKPSNKDRINLIKHSLYKTVSFNVDHELGNNSIRDVLIRKGSFSQIYDEDQRVHTVTFIVDIKSLKQSYNVSYQWPDEDATNEHINEYGTQVTCLPLDKLIYGNFDCVDERILEKGVENYDPIQQILPYTVQYRYTIKDYNKQSDDSVILNVEAFVPRWSNTDKTLDGYTKEILNWIESRKLNPDKYTLEYTY